MRNKESLAKSFHAGNAVESSLFTVNQIGKAVGLSRSSLIDLENKGYITPIRTDPKTGYRYYDVINLYQLHQYEKLRKMGLSQKEIFDFYYGELSIEDILCQMKERLFLIQQSVDEFALRITKEKQYAFSMLELPEVLCYCETAEVHSPVEAAGFAYNVTHHAISKGYVFNSMQPLMSLRADARTSPVNNPDKPYSTTICIPVEPSGVPGENADELQVLPMCTALSILYYGAHDDVDAMNTALSLLWKEMDSRHLTSNGPLRTLAIVAPYSGLEIDPTDYVFRFAMPVKDAKI